MFEQSPTLGPGIATVTQHSGEMLLLLTGAFLLGMLLSWLLSLPTVRQLQQTTTDLTRTKERLAAAERRPAPAARLRESNSTEHERTLSQLRESREAENRARERIIELEGRVALLEHERAALNTPTLAPTPTPTPNLLDAVLPFVSPADKPRKK